MSQCRGYLYVCMHVYICLWPYLKLNISFFLPVFEIRSCHSAVATYMYVCMYAFTAWLSTNMVGL